MPSAIPRATFVMAPSGMKRSVRVAITAGIVIFLSLVSSVSFAAWSASSSKSASAGAGSVSLTTSTSAGAPTITALGPHTYASINQPVAAPITVRNTGNVELAVSNVSISSSGTLAGSLVSLKFWAGTSSICAATTPVVTTTLDGGTASLSPLNMIIPASSSAILCAATAFTGNMATNAGQSASATLAIRAGSGTSWIANDSQSVANRTFTQQVFQAVAPNAPTNIQCVNEDDKNLITISWSTPSGFTAPNGGYNVYFDGSYIGNTTSISTLVANRGNTGTNALTTYDGNNGNSANLGNLTVRAVSILGIESVDSTAVPVEPRNGQSGLSCAS
ncbi:hypothetical protein A20C1_07638 [marine actinobacterium PHSC20C1]|nr:hypothetical protein A20C1_07638 [marine actinobacterium PHSC20C1]